MKTTRMKESACKGRTALALATAACLALAAASCKKDDRTEPAHSGEAVFTASTETHVGEGKTHLDNRQVMWDKDDEIVVFNDKEDAYHFKAGGGNSTSTDFTGVGTVPEEFYLGNKFQAYYPAGCVNESDRTVTLPRFQVYQEGGFAIGANPMAALSHGTDLQFKNLCGLLELRLKGDFKVAAIHVKSLNDDNLCGTGTVEWGAPDNENDPGYVGGYEVPNLKLTKGSNTVSLVCVNGENVDGVQLANAPTSFYIVVPAGTLEGSFSVDVVSNDHMHYGRLVSPGDAGHDIVRSRIRPMVENSVVLLNSEVEDGTLYGEFSVSQSDKVRFSKGNLRYNVDGTWNFCDKQTGYVETANVSANYGLSADSSSISQPVGLFGWGTSGFNHGAAHWQPWSTDATTSPDATHNYWAYGAAAKNLFDEKDQPEGEPIDLMTGKADWGANAIANGGNNANLYLWRVPKSSEWEYLLSNRGSMEGWKRFAKVKVGDVCGLLVFPDGTTVGSDNRICGVSMGQTIDNLGEANFYYLSSADWSRLEAAGVVFLPCAGYRNSNLLGRLGTYGGYWSSTAYGSEGTHAYFLYFTSSGVNPTFNNGRYLGFSVRLVR